MAEKSWQVVGVKSGDRESVKPPVGHRNKTGCFVAVRPCAEKFGGKTFLGILLGEVALGFSCRYDETDQKLEISFAYHNPAILIPDAGEIVYGCGSWWGRIKNEAHLREISDNDIQNVWYVKALQQIQAAG